MQNYEQILSELGIEVPEDKKTDLKTKMDENYRTKSDYDKVVTKRDEYKASLDDTQQKLEAFKDVNVDDLKEQITTLTTQLNAEKTAREEDARRIETEKKVNEFFASVDDKGAKQYEFLNEITEQYYRDALTKELDKDSAKGKSISDIFNGMITDAEGKQKEGIFVDRQQVDAKKSKAVFTKPAATKKTDGQKYTMSELMKMKNDDPDLDITAFM